ncbi:TonB-dependent receptor [Seonamhaeicola sp.]|uniref:TonB-dependent receptor domain-containing protein n=1 Tax=Seonamhaeicola sp. TaxID=1912245 RepID=UPI0026397E9B|nr:TonB-dependent receptor [Seonamhaeicola sp.]
MTLKRNGLFIILFISFTHVFSQSKISGKIVDADNNTYLDAVSITNIGNQITLISSTNGTFQLDESGTYVFKKEGYIEKTMTLELDKHYIIQLDLNPSQLNEVLVSANHLPQRLKKSVATIGIISSQDIQRGNHINMNEVLNRVPGVFMQSGALNTNRITIRGIGSRNLFGTAKIRAYFQDIPLTSGNGDTNIEDFELDAIGRMEIIKGAASSIYGAGLGGTIHLTPKNTALNQTSIGSELTIGSFGLIKSIISINQGGSNNGFRAIYSSTDSDGYRDNNAYNRETFTLNSSHYISQKDNLSFLASIVNLKAFIPSSINRDDYLNDSTAAAFTWGRAKGFEDSKRGIFGLSWNHHYADKTKHITSVFTSFRQGYEPRPFNILDENTWAIGMRSRIVGNSRLFNENLNWTIGGEVFKDSYQWSTYDNLYSDFPAGTGSVMGVRLSDFKEKRKYYNLFFETNYDLGKKTRISLGLNLNETSYTLDDRFIAANNPDQSGNRNFGTTLSPKFGISQVLSENTSLYGNVSHGFSPPSLEETLLPDGLINTNIEPETGWNYELGTRGSLANERLQFNLAIYRLSIRNLLVARRTAADQYIGVNAGKTQHDGLEAALQYEVVSKASFKINASANITLNHYKFEEFVDDDNDFSGNDLTGVPSEVFNAIVDFDSQIGLYGNINFQQVGNMPITDANTLYSESYSLTNCRIGFKRNLNKKLKFNLFIGLNNIFDKHYASQILINASSFGGSAPRYYYPGNPVNYYSGINLNYRL